MGGYELKGKSYWTDYYTGMQYYLGDDMAEYSLYKRAIKYAIANGVTVVASAGNEGLDCSNKKQLTEYLNKEYSSYGLKYEGLTYATPAHIKGVITVSATDNNDLLAPYSNFGQNFIDITAPGGNISGNAATPSMCFTTDINSGYTFTQGTSFSAPKVSAVVALVLCENPNLTPKLVAKRLYKTADKLYENKYRNYYGAGSVNAYTALTHE